MPLNAQHVHIVGIGGFGMSAIARILLQQGIRVSGSDLRANDLTRALAEAGAVVFEGHRAENIAGADLVACSSAVPAENPELVAARAANIPVMRRRDLLGHLMDAYQGIAVAGTHGKTTTTALIAHLLISAGLDPTYIVGGVLGNTGTNAGVGQGPHFVIEADEYDRMFLGLRPQIAVITNIEHDHPDCYPTFDEMLAAFRAFADLLPSAGRLIVCADDPHAAALGAARRAAGLPVITYGLESVGADWRAADLTPDAAGGTAFEVWHGAMQLGHPRLNLAGRHNVLNALAALAAADCAGVPFEAAARALDSFAGTGRRSELMGTVGGVTVINDYAHHPTAIRVTLEAQRARPGVGAIWAVWQPHTYGRLRALAADFAAAFASADHVLVTDVYSVREPLTPGLGAPEIAEMIRATGHPDARWTGSLAETAAAVVAGVRPGELVLLLSAGDAPQVGRMVLDHLRASGGEE